MSRDDEPDRQAFEAFVRAETDDLLRAATVLTCDRHHAEDLVQAVLARVATRWRRIDDPPAYARRVLYTQFVSWWRRRRVRVVESLTASVPDRQPSPAGDPETVLLLRQALAKLTPKQRAVLVLRYYEDLTEAQTAARLGCRTGTVKSQTRHAIARLRVLAPELAAVVVPEGVRS